MKPFSHHSFSGPTEIPPVNTSKELGHGAWGILSGSNAFRASNDASLFSSSLPVLPHAKLNLNDTEGNRYQSSEDDLSSDLEKIHLNVKGSAPIEEMKAHAIGNSLPGDEDELLAGIADDFDLSGLPGSLDDLGEYDFFDSGGGMELESDVQESHRMTLPQVNLSDNALGSGLPNYAVPNGSATVAGEHPYGEHPSRTLFVRNINSNVEDAELKALFEQYGDIRTLYTACKHRGFVMITYYDIRDARTAMRALQNRPLRRRKLDIHFSIPKDNPSDKDVNQGTLVVFNLDPSVSNEDLRLIFGTYGEVKEIRETPHKRHHKFVEYYDSRAAEAALKSLNRIDIAGKRIKLEPSRPGGARRNLMLQLNQDLEQEESRSFRPPVGSPITDSPPGNWMQFSSPIEHNTLHTISKSPNFTSLSPTNSTNLPGLAALLHPQLPNVVKVLPIGKDHRGSSHLEQLLNSANSSQASSFQQSNSFPEPKLSQFHGSLPSFGPPSTSNGSKVETLSGPQFLWGSPKNSENGNPAWTRTVGGHQFATTTGTGKAQGFPLSGHHGSFYGSSSNHNHHHHVGSAPSGVPLDRRFNFFPKSPETSILNSAMYGNINMGLARNDGKIVANMVNMATRAGFSSAGFSLPGNMSENSTLNYKMMSSPRLSPVFLGNGLYPGLHQTSIDGFSEHGRSKRMENNGSMVDSKKQFQLDLDRIVSGEDMRTTLMIKNIPNKYTSKMLLAAIDENHKSTYDFLYLPIDFKNKCNVGYAFINMLSPSHIIPFYEAFNGKKWEKFNSEKVALLAYARIQGKTALVTHFQNSSLMNEDKRCRPILFYSEGSPDFDEVIQEHLPSNSLNIQVSQPNGSLSVDFSGSPTEHNFRDIPEKS